MDHLVNVCRANVNALTCGNTNRVLVIIQHYLKLQYFQQKTLISRENRACSAGLVLRTIKNGRISVTSLDILSD